MDIHKNARLNILRREDQSSPMCLAQERYCRLASEQESRSHMIVNLPRVRGLLAARERGTR